MPYFEAPTNDIARLTFLQASIDAGANDELAGNVYLSSQTRTEIGEIAAAFADALSAIPSARSIRSEEVEDRQEAMAALEMYVRDLLAGVRRRTRRMKHPASVMQFYQLPLDGTMPQVSGQAAWLTMGADVVRGDAEAVARGYPPMCNPTAAEVDAVLTRARAESSEAGAADRVFDEAQEAVAALRPQVDEMIEAIMLELRLTLRRKDKASQRRIMRTFGATFAYLEGETPDPDDQPETAPTP